MALQVWLPLTGTLENRGLSNVTVTNNNATVNSAGKIGSCYSFNGSNSYLSFSSPISLEGDHSICCWLDLSNVNSVQYFISFGNYGIRYSSTDNNFLYYAAGVTRTWNYTKVNRFVHVTFVCKSNSLGLYVDGVAIGNSQSLTVRSSCEGIGKRNDGYYYNGKINDFRIYDHALSKREVHDLAQGLIMHYKLDPNDESITNTNLVAGSYGGTDAWSGSSSYISTDVPSFPTGLTNSYGPVSSKEYIPLNPNHTYMMSAWVKRGTSSQNYLYLTLIPYDVDKKQISAQNQADGFRADSQTTLAQDLHDGDTIIYLTDASGWTTTATYAIWVAIFGYKDSTGYIYPDMVYTQRVYQFGTTSDKSNLDIPNNRVTLRAAYHGETIPAGTCICQSASGSTYFYANVWNSSSVDASVWTHLAATFVPKNVKYLKAARYAKVVPTLYGNQWAAAPTLVDLGLNLISFGMSTSYYTQSNYASRTTSTISNYVYHVNGYQSSDAIDTSFSATSASYITLSPNTDYYLSFFCDAKTDTTLEFGTGNQAHTCLVDSSNVEYRPSTAVTVLPALVGNTYSGMVTLKIHTGTPTQYKVRLGFDTPNLYGVGSFIEFYGISLTLDNPRTIYDYSGYRNDGTTNGMIQTDIGSPRYRRTVMMKCIGSNQKTTYNYIYGPQNPLGLTPTVYTAAFWFKGTARYSGGVICTSSNTSFSDYTATVIHDYDNSIRSKIGDSTYELKAFSTYNGWITDGTWHHYAIVYDGSSYMMYKDGIVAQTVSAVGALPTFNYISLNYANAGGAKRGVDGAEYSDFRFYTTALSAADIKELYDTAATIDKGGNFHSFEFYEDNIEKGLVEKTGEVKTNDFIEKLEYLYLPAGRWVSTGLTYAANDTCKAVTVLRYDVSGSGRDLMGYSGTQYGYWGVTNTGAWEQHGTFSYTDADITKKNTISYERTDPYAGTYQVGALNGSYSVRNKYIYSVKLWKNGTLERDMVPVKIGNDYGLYDIVTYTFYPCNNNTNVTISSDPTNTTIFKRHIDTNQLLEK